MKIFGIGREPPKEPEPTPGLITKLREKAHAVRVQQIDKSLSWIVSSCEAAANKGLRAYTAVVEPHLVYSLRAELEKMGFSVSRGDEDGRYATTHLTVSW